MIQLIAKVRSGEAICPATTINNVHVSERRYAIVEHVVTLDNQPDPVLQHDFLALCSMPDGQYRAMMPSEQNALRWKQEQAATVEE